MAVDDLLITKAVVDPPAIAALGCALDLNLPALSASGGKQIRIRRRAFLVESLTRNPRDSNSFETIRSSMRPTLWRLMFIVDIQYLLVPRFGR